MAQQSNLDKSLITYTILSEGSAIEDTAVPTSIRVAKSINKIPYAYIEFEDGSNTDNEAFEIAHSKSLEPGKKITIKSGYESDEKVVFEGLIIKHQLKIRNGRSVFLIECKDEALKMTKGRKNEIYLEKKDSDIIAELIKNSGLKAEVSATKEVHKEIIQHYISDWDFMMLRADINKQVVIVDDGKIAVAEPDSTQSALFDVTYGTNLFDFDAEMDAKGQYKEVTAIGWDETKHERVEAKSTASIEVKQGSITSDSLSSILGDGATLLQTSGNMSVADLENWGQSLLQRSRLAKIKGTATIIGNADVKPNTVINFEGLSNTFNGAAYISGVYHIIEEGDWKTELQIGLSESAFAEEMKGIESPTASGLNAGFHGLQMAIVQTIHEDPDSNFRVQVIIPSLNKDNMPIWARLSNFYSTDQAGIFFMPEIGDEVVLGFVNDDPKFPIILGSLYSSKLPAKYKAVEENEIKSISTKAGLEIQFDDSKKILSLIMPSGNTVVMDDDQEKIIITDTKNKNTVELSADGISINADKDIKLSAGGSINMEAKSDIVLKATGDLNAEGMNVELKGSAKFAAEGAQVEVKGSAMTTIKGGIVQIN